MFHPSTGALYSTEHGPRDNDEVNLILAGRNYGWPGVHGFCDNDVLTGETEFCTANNVAEPLAAWTPTIAPGRRGHLRGESEYLDGKGASCLRR